jgi:hypothetical protein
MNRYFEIKNKVIIYSILDKAEYGTLAVSVEDIPLTLYHSILYA